MGPDRRCGHPSRGVIDQAVDYVTPPHDTRGDCPDGFGGNRFWKLPADGGRLHSNPAREGAVPCRRSRSTRVTVPRPWQYPGGVPPSEWNKGAPGYRATLMHVSPRVRLFAHDGRRLERHGVGVGPELHDPRAATPAPASGVSTQLSSSRSHRSTSFASLRSRALSPAVSPARRASTPCPAPCRGFAGRPAPRIKAPAVPLPARSRRAARRRRRSSRDTSPACCRGRTGCRRRRARSRRHRRRRRGSAG